jgi:hypothetical protein
MKKLYGLFAFVLIMGTTASLSAQTGQKETTSPNPQTQQAVPVMDGGAGPCSLDLTITADGKPATVVKINVHIVYGFAGVRRLDLEAYANYDGKVRFTGLPARVHRPPLAFYASKGDLTGMAVYNPESECNAQHEIVLTKKKQEQQQ